MRYGPPFRYAHRSDGRRVAYQVVGDGDLDLVFLFGWPTHLGLMWENPSFAGFLGKLASISRLILFDRVGGGLSNRGGTPPLFEDEMDDARAIRAADALRAGLRELGLEVQVGLHTGECELLGEDIGGIAVHIAARVLGQAGAGEVLCSRTVKDLVAGSGFRFADRGTHRLKGIPDDWQLYAVELAEG
jgi:class 3 adenylate cyclase